MSCPDKEVLQDYVDGDLAEDKARSVEQHLQSCDHCQNEVAEMVSLLQVLGQVAEKEVCPSSEELEKYVKNTAPGQEAERIREHIDLCAHCNLNAWALGASPEELQAWEDREQTEFHEYESEQLGFRTAQEVLRQLLPGKLQLLEKAWQSVVDFMQDLPSKTIDALPSFDKRAQLVGALGFSESYDPEMDAACTVLITTLYVSEKLSERQAQPSPEEIAAIVEEAAAKLGAGKGLRNRLVEIIPTVIIQSRTKPDA